MAKNSTYWEKRIAKNIWIEYNKLEERNRELLNLYQTASKNIRDELYELAEKHSKDGNLSRTEMYRDNHLKALEEKYTKIIEDLGRCVEKKATDNMQTAFKETYQTTMDSLKATEFAMPNKKTMNAILKEPWRGSDFSKRLWGSNGNPGQMQKLVKALDGVLVYGLQTGKTVTQMAIELNNVMNKGFNVAHTLVRTESIHYMNSAALLGYQDAGVQYVQVWAAEDERTCDECGKYHEKVYPIDKCPILPFHPNCRCTILPVMGENGATKYNAKHQNDKRGLAATASGSGIPEHEEPILLSNIDYNDKKAVFKELKKFERNAIKESIETACVITRTGEVYKCFGTSDRVFPDFDLGDRLKGSSISHNHPIDETSYTFSTDDLLMFIEYDLEVLRGCDEKYTYEFTRDATQIDDEPEDWMTFENYSHSDIIRYAKEYRIGYRRWLND